MATQQPKYTLAVGAIFKNEGHCLKEWIEHYIFHGVQHFYLINDESTDNFAEILQPYIEKGYVTLNSPIWSRYMGRQHEMYNAFILPYLKTTDWLLMVDLDEFMWSPEDNNLHSVLSRVPNIGQIQVEHTLFGSNGHKTQPKSLVKGFTRRSVDSPSQNPGLRKYFVKSSYEFSSLNIHHATFVSKEHEKKNFILLNHPYFVLNHYNCQSESFWKNVKCSRGDADEYKVRDMELFKLNDQNIVEDTQLCDINARIIPIVPSPEEIPKYNAFIISVKESQIRRPHVVAFKEKLKTKGVQTDILDAFYWKTCDVKKALADYGLTYTAPNNCVSLSAIGCFLSHYKLWKRISEANPEERYIILEDDMDIGANFNLEDITHKAPSQFDVVYLWKRPEQAAQQPSHIVPGKEYSTYYTQWGTNAYMISPSAAKYCLDTIKTLDMPVDHLLQQYIFKNIRCFIMIEDYFNQQDFKSILLGDDPGDLVPQSVSNNETPIALCLLCVTPNPIWLEFLKTFTQYTLYIMVDKNNVDLTDVKAKYPMIHFLQISGELCKSLGYNDSNTAVYPAYVTIAWDKATYYFSEVNTTHPHVWLVEEDVFLYNEQTLTDMDAKHPQSDLVISPTTDRSWDAKQPWDWHWCNIPFDDTLVTYDNLFRGMVCCARMSNQLFKLCANYAQKNKYRKLMYIETFFPSLAKHHGLQIVTPDELKEITWNTKWVEKMPLTAGHCYHPMKDIGFHKILREAQNPKIDTSS